MSPRSTDEIMGWRGKEYSDIEPYCKGYFSLAHEPSPDFSPRQEQAFSEGYFHAHKLLNRIALP